MADMAIDGSRPGRETRRRAHRPRFAHGPLNLFLIVVGLALARPDDRLVPHLAALARRLHQQRLVEGVLASRASRRSQNYSDALEQHRHPALADHDRRSRSAARCCRSSSRALAGYALAWLDFPGRDWLFIVVIGLLVVPLQMALIPIFSLYNTFGIFDTVFSLILFHTAFALPFAIFLLRNFFIGIPKDILESARIDGASELRIFMRLILPLGLPAIASLAIFQFLWTWNDLLVALTLGRNTQPITVAIFSQLRQFGANIELIAPAAFLSLIVPLAVFFAFQRYFAAGPAGRLGEVSRALRSSVAGSPASPRTRRCAAAGSRPTRSPSSTRSRIPPPPGRAGRRRSGRRTCARRATGTACRVVSRARGARGAAARLASRRCCAASRTGTTRRSRSSSTTSRSSGGEAAGTRASAASASSGSARRGGFSVGGVGRSARARRDRATRGCTSRRSSRGDPRVVHAYEPHDYARDVTVIGAGLAAATEWVNALAAGATVISVRRSEPVRRR